MIEIGKRAKIQVKWKVSPYEYNEEKRNSLISIVAKKYGIKKDSVKIIPDFYLLAKDGELNVELLNNIQNPKFHLELFKEYLTINKIENCDFDFIKKIDSEINGLIDYHAYETHRQYTVKWVRWKNFLSYGQDNFFDFRNVSGLALLNGEPANQSGKTTFAIDLLHFLLFGKTDKADKQEKIFNKWLAEETEVVVEGCISINGEDYLIKRTLTRPQLKKRTASSKTTQKVEYYHFINDTDLEELEDYVENKQEENSVQTNKIIKENIGNEDDFDLIICATNSNIDELIEKKPTERGKILSRWIGLLPLEEKGLVAAERYKTEIKPYLLSNKYNIATLTDEIEAFQKNLDGLVKEVGECEKSNENYTNLINELEENKKILYQSKQSVKDNISTIDITTLNTEIERLKESGLKKKSEIESLTEQINSIDVGEFNEDEYLGWFNKKLEITNELSELRAEYKHLSNQINDLKKGEYCPTCGRKLENVDNTSKINELQARMEELVSVGKEKNTNITEIDAILEKMKIARENFNKKSQLKLSLSACEVQISNMRTALRDKLQTRNEINENLDAIKRNNDIDIRIRNCEFTLRDYYSRKEDNIRKIENYKNGIDYTSQEIKTRNEIIERLKEEESIIRNWDIYLKMVGKKGISNMVLRKSLPIINAQLVHLLTDLCDFNVEIEMKENGDVGFYIIKNGVKADISSGSGFEKTISALALRFVLGKNSVIPKMGIIVLDELFGRVASENLDNIKTLLDRVSDDYRTMIIVSHLDTIKDWCSTIITVCKDENGVSHLKTRDNK